MNFKFPILIILLFVFFIRPAFSQTKAEIVITNVQEIDKKLIIDYDIINARDDELFEISVEVYQKISNVTTKPISTSGDVGNNIEGGKNKQIVWDMIVDKAIWDEDVNIKLYSKAYVNFRHFKFSKLLIASTFWPGAGLKKLNRKGGARILGVFGYAGVASAVYFNYSAEQAYSDYLDEDLDYEESDKYLETANQYRMIAMASAASAVSIWALNYILLGSKWAKIKKKGLKAFGPDRIQFHATYNPYMGNSGITLNYKF